jgi:hypothetical protein
MPEAEKRPFLLREFDALTRHHYSACPIYRNIVDRLFGGLSPEPYSRIEDIPFIPVSLFKERDLLCIPRDQVFKVLTSSGTTGQQVSKVYLDRRTADLQAKALVRTMQHFLGKDRLPMVVLDHPGVVKDRTSFSARGAGILGMMQFGRQPIYALNDDMSLNLEGLADYIGKHQGERIFYFGFTFMVWQHVVAELRKLGRKMPPNKGALIHSGGWKKLEHARVSHEVFNEGVRSILGVDHVINFYGMVEQVGGVFFENSLGRLQAPVFSDVIVRDPQTLAPLPPGQPGLVQVLSILPGSYPGHSLLTADLGQIDGVDHPEAGGFGRYFSIHGRAPRTELRGCSDTYEKPSIAD